MATMMEYLEWRGDIPFTVSPVNETDRYIISKLGMPDLSGIVPDNETYVPARQALARFFAEGREKSMGTICSPHLFPVLKKALESPRFGDVMISGYRQHIAPEDDEQFAALTVRLPGGETYVTFRGTDDSIVGWKEDLLMTVMDAVPAQADALRYLRWALEAYPGELIVGGHSKGGNLAVFACANLDEKDQRRIPYIFTFDSPGFQEEFLRREGYRRVRDRVRLIIPRNTAIGALMYREADCDIVRSPHFWSAHDGFTWEVETSGRFIREEGFSAGSRAFDRAMKDVLENRSVEERRAFIEELFGTLTATGARTVKDLTEKRLRDLLRTVRDLNQEPAVQKWMGDTLEALLACYLEEKSKNLSWLGTLLGRRGESEQPLPEEPAQSEESGWYET